MFVAFIDESGNDGHSAVFAMASILLCDLSSYFFANDWAAMLGKFGITGYHATDFHGRRGEFRGWDDCRDTEFRNHAVGLFLKWKVKHHGVGIPRGDFQRSFTDTGFHLLLRPAVAKWKKPYLQAFQHIISDLRAYADHQPRGQYIRPIFDNCQEFLGQAKQDYAAINSDGKLGCMYVANAQEYPQLQAADFLVWEYRTHLERRLSTGDRSPNSIMDALSPHMFNAQVWTFEYLEYLRKRTEAVLRCEDPDAVEAPWVDEYPPFTTSP